MEPDKSNRAIWVQMYLTVMSDSWAIFLEISLDFHNLFKLVAAISLKIMVPFVQGKSQSE